MARFNAQVVRWATAVAVIQVTISAPSMTRAQQPNGSGVVIDHATRTPYFDWKGERHRIDVGERIRVPKPYRVKIVVENTNSALYTCGVTATVARVPELDSLHAFLVAVGPYVAAAAAAPAPPKAPPPTSAAADTLKMALDTLDRIVTGPQGLQWALRLTFEALDTLRFDSGPAIAKTAAELGRNLLPVCDATGCRSLLSRILRAESNIARRLELVVLKNPTPEDTLIVMAARAALAGEDKVVTAAYGVEAIVRATLNASDTMVCDSVAFASDEGRDLTITVAPRPIPELARLADRRPYELKVTVLPKWGPRLAFSPALMYAFGATFPTYNTISVDASHLQVIEAGTQDLRWNYGLTLALTWDWRHAPCHVTLWPLEFSVLASTDNPGLGIGTALSMGVFKVSVGALWLKHDQLDGISVGSILNDANLLRKKPVRAPRIYLSASLAGWQR